MAKPSPALEERYWKRLLENLRRQDLLEVEKKEVASELNEALKHEKKIEIHLRNLIEGTESEQTEIPGTEEPESEPYEIGAAAERVKRTLQAMQRERGKEGGRA